MSRKPLGYYRNAYLAGELLAVLKADYQCHRSGHVPVCEPNHPDDGWYCARCFKTVEAP